MPPTPPERLVIIRLSAFGDIVCALPTLDALRASFPDAFIGWVVDSRFAELVASDPRIDRVHIIPLRQWARMVKSPRKWPVVRRELRAFTRGLCEADYQVSLDVQGIIKSGSVARLIHCPRNLQMAGDHLGNKQALFGGERIPALGPHLVERMLPLAAALGADVSEPRFGFFIPEEARRHAASLLDGHDFGACGPLVALNPGASVPCKTWPREGFVAVARRLREEADARIVVLGGPQEVALAEAIAREAQVGALCTAGRTGFLQLAALLEHCATVVTGDTGPMHLAAAVGRPTVALIGPTDPARTGPYGAGHVILHKPIPCRAKCTYARCRERDCMTAIGVDEVVSAVREVLGRPAP